MNYGIFTAAGSALEAVMHMTLGKICGKYERVSPPTAPLGSGAPFAIARFHRLAHNHQRLPETPLGLHFLACALLMLSRLVAPMWQSA